MYQRILVPFDGSSAAVGALDQALTLAREGAATVRLVHVVDELKYAGSSGRASRADDLLELMEDAGEIILQQGRSRVQACGLRVGSVLYTSSETLCAVIAEQVAAWRPDLIALCVSFEDGSPPSPSDSNALEILRASMTPILMVPHVKGRVHAQSLNPKEPS